MRVNELCRLDICLNYLLSLWYYSYVVISNLNVLRGSFITSDIVYVKRKIKLLLVRPGLCNVCSKGIFIPSLLQMHELCSWLDVKWFLFSKKAETFKCELKLNDIHSRKIKRFPTVIICLTFEQHIQNNNNKKKTYLRCFWIKFGRKHNKKKSSRTQQPLQRVFFFFCPTAVTKFDISSSAWEENLRE